MTFIGNVLLVISILIFFMLNTGAMAKPAPGGDTAVGYAWSQIILNLAFVIVMILVTIIIGFKNGFDWVSSSRSNRILWVTVCMLSIVFTAVLSTFFRHEAGPAPVLLKSISSFAPILLPLVMIVAGFILLNRPIRESIPLAIYKWPLIVVSIIGIIGTVSGIASMVAQSARNQAAIIKDNQDFEDRNHQNMLATIDSTDVMKEMVLILVFTGDNQDADVRERSVAKVKTNPQWQQELVRLIQTEWAPEPFQFLASNDVDDPSMFLEPVRAGVLMQAQLIRESIRRASHPSHFYEGQFSWEVERVIRTVNKFKNKGVDYVPAMKELRKAFDEPSEFEKPKWRAVKMMEKWIAENE